MAIFFFVFWKCVKSAIYFFFKKNLFKNCDASVWILDFVLINFHSSIYIFLMMTWWYIYIIILVCLFSLSISLHFERMLNSVAQLFVFTYISVAILVNNNFCLFSFFSVSVWTIRINFHMCLFLVYTLLSPFLLSVCEQIFHFNFLYFCLPP